MSKKIIRDQVFFSKAAALAAVAEAQSHCAAMGLDLWNIVQDNLPTMTDGDDILATFGPDENNLPTIAADTSTGTLALVTIYSDRTLPQTEGDALAIPKTIYFLSLPNVDEIKADAKLGNYLQDLLAKDLLARARRLAKGHDADPAANPLSRDRIAALIAAQSARGGDPAAKAFKALFPVLQAVILAQVDKAATALKNAKRTADARLLAATFNRQRLNAQTLLECLSSTEAAKLHFPSMAQAQWENILRFAVKYAPAHKIRVAERTEDGKTTVKDAAGKTVYLENVPCPVSPVPFSAMLETRDSAHLNATNAPTLDLSDLMAA